MEYVYICQTHGYFCEECNKPHTVAKCPECNKDCMIVQEKHSFLNSIAYKDELKHLWRK